MPGPSVADDAVTPLTAWVRFDGVLPPPEAIRIGFFGWGDIFLYVTSSGTLRVEKPGSTSEPGITIPYDTWIEIRCEYDVSAMTMTVWFDDVDLGAVAWTGAVPWYVDFSVGTSLVTLWDDIQIGEVPEEPVGMIAGELESTQGRFTNPYV